MMRLTYEQKTKILSKNEFTPMVGYCFNNPTDQDYSNHFVSKEEVDEAIKKGFETYFWKEDFDYIMTLETAWENFIEYYYDDKYEQFGDDEEALLESLEVFLRDE